MSTARPRGAPRAPGRAGAAGCAPADLRLSLQQPDGRLRPLLARRKVARWVCAALEGPAEIAIRIVDEHEGRRLNREFRGRDYATNVLTFDYAREPVVVADLVLCAPVLEREAQESGVSLVAHCAHLVLHGVLHARGFDHQRAAQARVMEARESALLRALGFPDPYAR